jgi:hypothetical protein
MLRLIKMWLKVPVEERDENGKPRVSARSHFVAAAEKFRTRSYT